jgi:hypothetical protein
MSSRRQSLGSEQLSAYDFAAKHGIDIDTDRLRIDADVYPVLTLGGDGKVWQRVEGQEGVRYDRAQIDYCPTWAPLPGLRRAVASRLVARVLAGHRTEVRYRAAGAGSQRFTVGQGEGVLFASDPWRPDEAVGPTALHSVGTNSQVDIPGRQFYVFEAAAGSELLVSSLHDPRDALGGVEFAVRAGAKTVNAPEGLMTIPPGFLNRHVELVLTGAS